MVLQADVLNYVDFMDELIDWFVSKVNANKASGASDITS